MKRRVLSMLILAACMGLGGQRDVHAISYTKASLGLGATSAGVAGLVYFYKEFKKLQASEKNLEKKENYKYYAKMALAGALAVSGAYYTVQALLDAGVDPDAITPDMVKEADPANLTDGQKRRLSLALEINLEDLDNEDTLREAREAIQDTPNEELEEKIAEVIEEEIVEKNGQEFRKVRRGKAGQLLHFGRKWKLVPVNVEDDQAEDSVEDSD